MYQGYADTWNQLRLRQLFPELQQSSSAQSSSFGPEMDPYNPLELEQPDISVPNIDATERYKQYTPQMQMQNRFAEAARNPPNRMDFKPTGMQRVMASLAGFSGSGPTGNWGGVPTGFRANPNQFGDTQNILDRPYNQAMADYKLQIDPLRAAADDERMGNQVQSNFLDRTVNRDIQENNLRRMFERDQTTARQGDTRLEQAQQKIDIASARAEIYRLRGEQRELRKDENGYVYGVNKNDPTDVVYAQDDSGNRIKDSQLPERERLLIIQGNRIEAIEATGQQNRETKGTAPGAAPPRTTTSKNVIRDAQGNILRSTTNQSTSSSDVPANAQKRGNEVVMYAPNGQAAWIPFDKTDQAQEDGFTFNDPRTGPDFRPPTQRRVPILGGR